MDVRRSTHAIRASWAPSRFRRIARNRWVRSSVVLAVGVAATLAVSAQAAQVEAARTQWGELVSVLIVQQPVTAGGRVADSVAIQEIPRAMAPASAIESIEHTSTARVNLFPGEILQAERVIGPDDPLPPGHAALTLSMNTPMSLVRVGSLVDLWTIDSANLSSRRIAVGVVVLALGDNSITVAVADESVGEVTAASLRPVTVTLIS